LIESDIKVRAAADEDVIGAVAAYRAARQEAFAGLIPGEAILPRTYEQDVARWRDFVASPDGRLFVADLGLEVVGLAALEYAVGQAELGALYVDPGRQQSGAGSALLSAVLSAAGADGHREVIGWVLAANQPAKRFFLARGGWLDGGVEIRRAGAVKLTMQRIRFKASAPSGRHR
jgi:GNAT superfamily N-acetyltransferase